MAHSVDLAALDGFIDDMQAFDKEVQARIADLDAQMARLHDLWEGEAEQQQRAAHAELMKGIATMRQGLAQLRTSARTAHTNYGNAVSTNQGMMSQYGG